MSEVLAGVVVGALIAWISLAVPDVVKRLKVKEVKS